MNLNLNGATEYLSLLVNDTDKQCKGSILRADNRAFMDAVKYIKKEKPDAVLGFSSALAMHKCWLSKYDYLQVSKLPLKVFIGDTQNAVGTYSTYSRYDSDCKYTSLSANRHFYYMNIVDKLDTLETEVIRGVRCTTLRQTVLNYLSLDRHMPVGKRYMVIFALAKYFSSVSNASEISKLRTVLNPIQSQNFNRYYTLAMRCMDSNFILNINEVAEIE